ncbi:MAG: AAA family ATPase [Acidobacteriota bacterium]|nr:AAA family ATPase [Acidobacteriota bacterium]
MTDDARFPAELLSKPIDERSKWFKDVVFVKHRNITRALEAVHIAISDPPEGAIVNLFGPAGTGKTTVLRKAEQAVIRAALPTLDPGCIPFLLLEAPGPDRGTFDWLDFYVRALTSLKEVLINHKVRFDEETGKAKRISFTGRDIREARRIYEEILVHRAVKYVGVDEAHNFATIAKGRRLFDQTECIKSLGSFGKVLQILAGSYRLLDLRSLSGQVSRRSVSIHLANYDAHSKEDINEYKKVILTFQRRMPYPDPPDLEKHWEYLYVYSCGCVGILKDWLTKAYSLSLRKSHPTLTLEHLEKTALSKKDLDRLSLEIWEGKQRLANEEGPEAIERIKARLGFGSTATTVKTPGPPRSNTVSRRTRAGEPKLQRFPVAGEIDGVTIQ